MKKITYLFLAASILAAVSCAKPDVPVLQPDVNEPAEQTLLNPVTLTFTADPSTKVAIDGEGHASWEEGDKIQIVSFDDEGTAKYVKDIEVNIVEGVGTFTATVEDSDIYYAVYPSSLAVKLSKNNQNEDVFTVGFPSTRAAVKNINKALYYAAKTTATDKQFNFKAISTILKVNTEKDVTEFYFRPFGGGITYCTGEVPVAFDSEGKVSLSKPAATQANTTFTAEGPGTYYLVLPGSNETATSATYGDGFILRIDAKENQNDEEAVRLPAAYYENKIQLTPGKIYNIKNPIESKIITNYFVSPDGTGDGLTEGNPVALENIGDLKAFKATVASSMMRHNTTVNLLGGTYSTPLSTISQTTVRTINVKGATDGSTVFTTSAASTLNQENVTMNIEKVTFSGCTASALNITAGHYNFASCVFDNNTTTESGAFLDLGSKDSTDETLSAIFQNCKISKNTATSNGGAILVRDASKGGLVMFDHCVFDTNKSSANGGVARSDKGNAALMFNKCFFVNNVGGANGRLFHTGTATRIGLNCCSVNAGSITPATNGALMNAKGSVIFANTTVVSGELGKRGTFALGNQVQENASNIINCMIRNKSNTYGAFWFHKDYWQNVNYCLYSGHVDDATGSISTAKSGSTMNNSVALGDDPDALKFGTIAYTNRTIDGLTYWYYTWTLNVAAAGFTKPSKDKVRNLIAKTGESKDDKKDGFGKLFLDNLDAIDGDAFTKDLIGTTRPESGICPGCVETGN